MRALDPVTLTPGQTAEIDTSGDAFSSATVVLYNLSGYELLVQFTGGFSAWIAAHTADRFDLAQLPGWSGVIRATPQVLASNAAQAPSQVVLANVYASGEPVPGSYPMAIDRLSNVGNSVATVAQGTSAIQTGETPPNYLVRAAPAGYAQDTLDLLDTGELHVRGLTNSVETDYINIVPGGAGAATVQFHGVADNVPASGVQAGTLPAGVTLPAAQLGAGTLPGGVTVPAGSVSGSVASATAASSLSDGTHAFTSTLSGSDQVLDGQWRPVATPIGLAGTWWDGSAIHVKEVISPTGKINADTVPAAGISGSVPSAATAQQVDATNSGSVTTPQLETATASVGLGVKDNAGSSTIELYPTAPAATARTMQCDYQDNTGTLHAGPQVTTTAHGGQPAGGWLHPLGNVMAVGAVFSGSGAGTYNHFLHVTPTFVGITSTETNSTMTVGVDSIGSSTVHVNVGVAGWPFVGFATVT